jgi:CRP/FNR family transcriptional regulator
VPYVDCFKCPLRSLSAFHPLSEGELRFVRSVKAGQPEFAARHDIVAAGDCQDRVYTIFSGWAFRFMMLRNDCRQILDVLLPGDLIGLQAPMTGRVRHAVRALTDVSACLLGGEAFRRLFDDQPGLAEALVATLMYEEHRADTRLLLLGRQRPTERLGYFLLELRERLACRGMLDGDEIVLPLAYAHIADAIGVSRSQVGSSLLELRRRDWAVLKDGRLTFRDRESMAAACNYEGLPNAGARTLI